MAGIDPCRQGIHACRIEDLPLWLGLGELWMVELDDVAVEARKLVARRGRLVRRVEGWDGAAAEKFVAGCEARARSRAENAPELAQFADDIAGGATPAVAGYIAARAAELHRGPPEYDLERKWQADWLADRLGLSGRLVDDRRRRRFRWLGI